MQIKELILNVTKGSSRYENQENALSLTSACKKQMLGQYGVVGTIQQGRGPEE
jgi:hypothetical protein